MFKLTARHEMHSNNILICPYVDDLMISCFDAILGMLVKFQGGKKNKICTEERVVLLYVNCMFAHFFNFRHCGKSMHH